MAIFSAYKKPFHQTINKSNVIFLLKRRNHFKETKLKTICTVMYNSTNNPEHANNYNYQTNCIANYPSIESTPIMIPVLSPPPPPQPLSPVVGGDDEMPRRDERFPQWSNQETRDFIEIRAHLEWSFNIVKRNKNLWEMVVNRMREKGYRRTVDQCKCKWKNLVNRYKVWMFNEWLVANSCYSETFMIYGCMACWILVKFLI